MSNDGTLPLKILTDVLSRLPVKSLCRSKCVSPSWNSLISSPCFAKTHLNRTKTLKNPNQKILIVADNLLYSVDIADRNPTATKLNLPTAEQQPPEDWVRVYNSDDGLVLVSRRSGAGTELFLLNPSTRECKKLPVFPFVLDSANSFHTNLCGVGYDSSTDDYKVVMVSPAWSQSSPQWAGVSTVAVYSLETDSWRRIQDTNFTYVGSTGRVFVNGCLHGICWRDGSHVIVAFDLSNEVVREVPQPALYIGSDVTLYSVAVLGGCLCLVHKHASEFWKMEEYGVRESWTKFKIRSRSLFLLGEDEFLVNTTPGRRPKQLVVYNSREDTMRNMEVCGIQEVFFFEGTYVESLISPHHGGGIGRQ
ncbi:F-box/kelch-repeat protein At3g06240-like [Rhododendron vialii]|uniref:F-box/kelch-repeat protein At3g06240-like n=1 Tax=Rhododendron vialii TaxID=182163 RepID=UPI0026601993|nr:F-box/kelch-repeat protein At3g06240-like [Rhododendron vialii]XP_058198419.1 F-box/kelch-repeat protein At3g06240-like [Rhododendron vialii]XP_058198424.1 F-box/kelch-repeat protein At3g06240-like [Rhododendron vialii]XP_058198428.1 F-box/kelch-repeat protein At3g06240-like [Rhododendron vialii]XP_058198433.1 F-box/kelch-repeat protein At3g06240-like [Rhododendron vialii]